MEASTRWLLVLFRSAFGHYSLEATICCNVNPNNQLPKTATQWSFLVQHNSLAITRGQATDKWLKSPCS